MHSYGVVGLDRISNVYIVDLRGRLNQIRGPMLREDGSTTRKGLEDEKNSERNCIKW